MSVAVAHSNCDCFFLRRHPQTTVGAVDAEQVFNTDLEAEEAQTD